jgi:Na+/H+ antiporter NhaD/arsenite permease-like protein
MNRAIAALGGAIIVLYILLFIEAYNFSIIVELLFGNNQEGFVNLHTLILIMAMMLIVQISNEAGLFQFIAVKLIVLSEGKPLRLMTIFCILTVIIAALLNNILAVIILIPLTITISRILNIDPTPYILTEAILVNIGSTFFSISAITSIMITTFAKISFIEFFLNVGIISLFIFAFTLIFFIFLYKKELVIPKGGAEILKEFDAWNFVQSKRLVIECAMALIILMTLFAIIPLSLITPDIIALTIAITLIIISRLNAKEIITKIDYELILYLLGIFIIAGTLELIGVTDIIANSISEIVGGDILFQTLFILWVSAFLSSTIDNIPITKVLIPVINDIPDTGSGYNKNLKFYSLAIGANWGDNLTPLGDNILVLNISEQHKRPVSFKQFFKLGFVTTIYQLLIVTLIFILIFQVFLGIILISIILIIILISYILYKNNPKTIGKFLDRMITKIRVSIIK